MRRIPILVLLVSLILTSCSPPSEDDLLARGTEAVNAADYDAAIEAFETLLEEYPDSPRRPHALYALGGVYQNEQGDLGRALSCYREIRDRYPDHEKAPNSLFLIGFIYHNELGRLDSARAAYMEFLEKYPTNEMAASAEFELSHLGQSPDEIISRRLPESKAGSTAGKAPSL
jgi:TolA-binding protein